MKTNLQKLLCVLAAALVLSPVACMAQYMGTFSQQTVAQTFTGTMAAGATHQDLQNLGQAAHSIQVNASGCTVSLDASQDGTIWRVLALNTSNSGQTAYADGYYPHLRITLNFGSEAGCNGSSYTVNYAGYQFPLPNTLSPDDLQVPNLHVASPVAPVSASAAKIPWEISTISCYNPGASVAYLQIIDSVSPATLGTGIVFQTGIPAGQAFDYSGPMIYGINGAFLGASTTPGGATAVGTAVECSVQTSRQISFFGNQLFSP